MPAEISAYERTRIHTPVWSASDDYQSTGYVERRAMVYGPTGACDCTYCFAAYTMMTAYIDEG